MSHKTWLSAHIVPMLLVLFLVPTCASAEEENSPQGSVTSDLINTRIEEVEASTDLDENSKAEAVELFRRALSALDLGQAHDAEANTYAAFLDEAPVVATQLQEQVAKDEQDAISPESRIAADTDLEALESRLLSEKAESATLAAELDSLRSELNEQVRRPDLARNRIRELRQLLEAQDTNRERSTSSEEPPLLIEARQWAFDAEKSALMSETNMLNQELLTHAARVRLLRAERDLTALHLRQAEQRVDVLESAITQRRRQAAAEAQREAETVQAKVATKDPSLKKVADANAELTAVLTERVSAVGRVNKEQDFAIAEADRIERAFQTTKRKLEIAGLGYALGQALLKELQELPDIDRLRTENRQRERLTAESQLRLIQYEEDRSKLSDMDQHLEALVLELDTARVEEVRAELRSMLTRKRELLTDVIAAEEEYLRAEGEYDIAASRLLAASEGYLDYLQERLLWVRTTPTLSLEGLRQLPTSVNDLLSPSSWKSALRVIYQPTPGSLPLFIGLVVSAILIIMRRPLRTAIAGTAKNVNRPSMDNLGNTFRALTLTAVYALPLPIIVGTSGYALEFLVARSDFEAGLAKALLWVAPRLYLLTFARALFLRHGVAAQHFRWRAKTVTSLRRLLLPLMVAIVVADGLVVFFFYYDSVTLGGALGKLAFLLPVIALIWFALRVLHPGKGLLQTYLSLHKNGLLYRLRYLWFTALIMVPLGFAVTALAGYLYTAGALFDVFIDSLILLFLTMVAYQLALRWLLVTKRRLAFQAAMGRRAEAVSEGDDSTTAGRRGIEIDEPKIDLAELSEDSQQLIRLGILATAVIGLWWIWSEIFPALGLMRDVTLWHHSAVIDGHEVFAPITLANLLYAVAVAAVTWIAATRLPALMEIVLLHRTSMSSGGRYAFTTLSSYLIAAVGALAFFQIIGMDWSKLQWLVAALGVGIGFGLQEIVANFISGLIILFERPVRVGDVVTVGDTSGIVTRIRIRATTITNWDRKELLVPNKEFITGRLLNWSLSDPTTRIVIPVGIAYGSDVGLALKLLSEAAEENDMVLNDPRPMVAFEAFGDSALNLTLRCFIASIDDRVQIVTDLHRSIDQKFRAARISIAFPQMDVHIDSQKPLWIQTGGSTADQPG